MKKIKSVMKYIGYKEKAVYYIGSSLYSGVVNADNKVIIYLDYEDIFTGLDFIIHLLLYFSGNTVRYGIMYGFAVHI